MISHLVECTAPPPGLGPVASSPSPQQMVGFFYYFMWVFSRFFIYIYNYCMCVQSPPRLKCNLGELYWIYLYNTDGSLVKNSRACCWYETNCIFNILSAAFLIFLLNSWFHLLLFFNGWDGQLGRSKLQVCFYFHPHCQWKKYYHKKVSLPTVA